jgi:adenylate kinase family enzyme
MGKRTGLLPSPLPEMRRVVVFGIAGGGKSTLARRISAALRLPLHQTDKISFGADWHHAPPEEFNAAHDKILTTDCWIIDGVDPFESLERRCDQADTLILIDLPEWLHHWWALKRNLKHIFRSNPDLPEGCLRWPYRHMYRLIRGSKREYLPLFRQVLENRPSKMQFVLRSPRDIKSFCRQLMKASVSEGTSV